MATRFLTTERMPRVPIGPPRSPTHSALPGFRSGEHWPSLADIATHGFLGWSADRHPTCLLPLADHGHHVTADVVDGERRQLRNPETGRIEGVDQGTIAQTFWRGGVDRLDGVNQCPRREGMGQRLVEAGTGHALERIDRRRVAAPGVVVEGTDS